MEKPFRIFIEPRGRRYRVRIGSPAGAVIIEATSQPLLDGARVLLARGIGGRLEMWDTDRPFPRMAGDIERLARLTVNEDRTSFERWKAFCPSAVAPRTAKSVARLAAMPGTQSAAGARPA